MKWVDSFDYKLACDGYDLSTKFDGHLLNELAIKYANKHCKIDCLPNAEEFNEPELTFWSNTGTDLWGLQFLVVPSRDRNGEINEIGFRLLNQEKVKEAFKWLFPYGQQATFGLHLCDTDEQLLLVEGFQDMIAFRESGYNNVVGLGSVKDRQLLILPRHGLIWIVRKKRSFKNMFLCSRRQRSIRSMAKAWTS